MQKRAAIPPLFFYLFIYTMWDFLFRQYVKLIHKSIIVKEFTQFNFYVIFYSHLLFSSKTTILMDINAAHIDIRRRSGTAVTAPFYFGKVIFTRSLNIYL